MAETQSRTDGGSAFLMELEQAAFDAWWEGYRKTAHGSYLDSFCAGYERGRAETAAAIIADLRGALRDIVARVNLARGADRHAYLDEIETLARAALAETSGVVE